MPVFAFAQWAALPSGPSNACVNFDLSIESIDWAISPPRGRLDSFTAAIGTAVPVFVTNVPFSWFAGRLASAVVEGPFMNDVSEGRDEQAVKPMLNKKSINFTDGFIMASLSFF
jgi:hypothetical protein